MCVCVYVCILSILFQNHHIFINDKGFMFYLSMVESNHGQDAHTYANNNNGGIWQVTKVMYDLTTSSYAYGFLRQYILHIQHDFKIDWQFTVWQDLRKPLYSALAARLYMAYMTRHKQEIPRPANSQAKYWVDNYHHAASVTTWIKIVEKPIKVRESKGIDLVFILDDSGSVSRGDFRKMVVFTTNVVKAFSVSSSTTRVSLLKFSSSVHEMFKLNSHFKKSQVLDSIDRVEHGGGGTATYSALSYLRKTSFRTDHGGRRMVDGIARVGIVLTDGKSNSAHKTLMEAKACHEAGIILFAIGIGSHANTRELNGIASSPVFQNTIFLNGFSEFSSLIHTIQYMITSAPMYLNPGPTKHTNMQIIVKPGHHEKVTSLVSKSGTTMHFYGQQGSAQFYFSRYTYPSHDYYQEVTAIHKHTWTSIFIKHEGKLNEEPVFGNIMGGADSSGISIVIKEGNHCPCLKNPCGKGKCIDLGPKGHKCQV